MLDHHLKVGSLAAYSCMLLNLFLTQKINCKALLLPYHVANSSSAGGIGIIVWIHWGTVGHCYALIVTM